MELQKHSRVVVSFIGCGAAISTNYRASVEEGMFTTFQASLCDPDRANLKMLVGFRRTPPATFGPASMGSAKSNSLLGHGLS